MPENRICQNCSNDFEVSDNDFAFYKKIDVPPPKNCPTCRMVRRFMDRNPKNLYYRKCDFTNAVTLSQYHKNQLFPVYSPKTWWSDKWDGLNYGQNPDFNRPFFEQFLELKNKTPHLALFNTESTIENSDYNNCTGYLKNCYLIGESDYCEDSYYSNLLKKCKSVVDCSVCYQGELCYECIDCTACNRTFYSQDCQNCNDSYLLFNCIACSDCIGCINQRHKQYMIFNQQYTKDEYEKLKSQFELSTISGINKLKQQTEVFFKSQHHKALIAERNQNSSGDHLFNSKNAFYCFDSVDLEDCSYCAKLSLGVKSSMDYNSWGNQSELIYQSTACGDHCYNLKFCSTCQSNMSNCEYCIECFSCTDCFGCIGLKKEKFCILNKKYSETEYHQLKTKIIEHMKNTGEYGDFFPVKICPFGYNETMAMDTFPLTKKEALAKGYKWHEEEFVPQKPQNYKIPENILDVQNDVIKAILVCNSCNKNFKIIAQELTFYKNVQIPIPLKCPSCRYQNRMAKRRPLKLWQRACAKCKTQIQTSYSPDRPEIVYCEKCYLATVY